VALLPLAAPLALQRPRFPHQGSHPSGDTLFTRQRRQKRSRETSELLRTIHALEVTLEGLDRFAHALAHAAVSKTPFIREIRINSLETQNNKNHI
jgi:hypothetical protein